MADNFDTANVDGLAVERLPRIPSKLNIRLTEKFHARPSHEQQRYLHELASTMNHALDVMQKERDEVIAICHRQEDQIKKLNEQNRRLADQIQAQVVAANQKAEARVAEILELKAEVRRLRE